MVHNTQPLGQEMGNLLLALADRFTASSGETAAFVGRLVQDTIDLQDTCTSIPLITVHTPASNFLIFFLSCVRGREPWRTIANPSRASEQACVRACVRGRTHGACAAPLALCRLPFVVAVSPGLAFIWVSSSTFSAAAYSAFCSSARQNRQLACVHSRARAQPGHTRAREQKARSRTRHAGSPWQRPSRQGLAFPFPKSPPSPSRGLPVTSTRL